ncbi:hypothetical protein ACIN5087_2882 [Acinetobacter baumannii OIFC087]|nr:hypothetical protein ACIN5087_2882 [Acinetobacter baumannii OIFC087]
MFQIAWRNQLNCHFYLIHRHSYQKKYSSKNSSATIIATKNTFLVIFNQYFFNTKMPYLVLKVVL